MRQHPALAFALLLAAAPATLVAAAPSAVLAQAAAADPAAQQVSRLDEALLATMRQAKSLGPKGRFTKLEPVISQVFDLPTMTRFAVGPTWNTLQPAEQQELVRAFSRMTVATYAHNFDSYNNQNFQLVDVQTRGPDKLVHTRLIGGSDKTDLVYRMRQSGGTWKVIDVYYNGAVSSLLGQRSEYAATLKTGGAPALVKKLNNHANELLA
jgi:phospholipid transport system substrate-binding protein